MIDRRIIDTAAPLKKDRANALLLAGALLGALLAASGLFEYSADFDPEAVAQAGRHRISREEYLAHLSLYAESKRQALSAREHRRVLQRLLEEKLLIARGVELGLPWSDPAVSRSITQAMLDAIVNRTVSPPDPARLQAFYRDNLPYFTAPASLRVARMAFRGPQAEARARHARAQLQTAPWAAVAATADPVLPALPAAALPLEKLRAWLGAALTAQAQRLRPGQFSAVLADGDGYSILLLHSRTAAAPAPLASVREQVAAEYLRRAEEQALQTYLQQLRDSVSIHIDEAFLRDLQQPRAAPD